MTIRPARIEDAPAIHALIEKNRERGHLLPRTLADISARIGGFFVADQDGRIAGCGEAARLSRAVAEIRSLVVDEPWRGNGVASRLVAALHRRARLDGRERLCAFAHDPIPFIRLGFSIVPHAWLPEKISADCARCPLFRSCGQYALMISLQWQRRSQAA
ncbi:MAG TPA: GNAT family N-acetyltransferase [Vicinamibacterales bacterium]|nr:GNAT family N-acetyltransferase [Vicinamibacterales bacterium]